jgi:hypothetical protein
MTKPSEEQIRARAYELWEEAGKPEGREQEFWQKAEQAPRAKEELRDIATSPPPTEWPG